MIFMPTGDMNSSGVRICLTLRQRRNRLIRISIRGMEASLVLRKRKHAVYMRNGEVYRRHCYNLSKKEIVIISKQKATRLLHIIIRLTSGILCQVIPYGYMLGMILRDASGDIRCKVGW